MKLVTIIYNLAIDEEVKEELEKLHITCYTHWPRVTGCGRQTGPRHDDSVWPGANCCMEIVLEDAAANELMDHVRILRRTIGQKEGIFAFKTHVEDYTD